MFILTNSTRSFDFLTRRLHSKTIKKYFFSLKVRLSGKWSVILLKKGAYRSNIRIISTFIINSNKVNIRVLSNIRPSKLFNHDEITNNNRRVILMILETIRTISFRFIFRFFFVFYFILFYFYLRNYYKL